MGAKTSGNFWHIILGHGHCGGVGAQRIEIIMIIITIIIVVVMIIIYEEGQAPSAFISFPVKTKRIDHAIMAFGAPASAAIPDSNEQSP